MKTIFSFLFVAAAVMMVSCAGGNNAAAKAKATADSIAYADSVRTKCMADSMACCAKADSMAAAEAAALVEVAPVKK